MIYNKRGEDVVTKTLEKMYRLSTNKLLTIKENCLYFQQAKLVNCTWTKNQNFLTLD